MSLKATGSVLHPVPLQQCAPISNIAGNACNTMKQQRGAVRLRDTTPCFFMEQCCIVWTGLYSVCSIITHLMIKAQFLFSVLFHPLAFCLCSHPLNYCCLSSSIHSFSLPQLPIPQYREYCSHTPMLLPPWTPYDTLWAASLYVIPLVTLVFSTSLAIFCLYTPSILAACSFPYSAQHSLSLGYSLSLWLPVQMTHFSRP